MRRPPDLATLRAAWWAQRALHRARRQLPRRTLDDVALPRPPRLPPHAVRGVRALLRRRPHSCLEGALVAQRWLAACGDRRDVVIGVTAPGEDFGAHAWLDGDPVANAGTFRELRRVRP
ncbi:MAG TPA: lasso peptide biosynthesis B2 protein [Solirubrobacteraceae bacterium]|nr:lasso peptide biosynthesis B2 protein [Solirubrobacteraceae bacterium]